MRSSIQRRLLVGQMADLAWSGPLHLLIEYVKMILQIFYQPNTEEGEPR